MSSEQPDDPNQVLIVDDDMFNLEILKNLLSIKYAVQSRQACSGKIAIDMIMEKISEMKRKKRMHQKRLRSKERQRPLSNERQIVDRRYVEDGVQQKLPMPFKIIFMDCNMPIMDGFTTSK